MKQAAQVSGKAKHFNVSLLLPFEFLRKQILRQKVVCKNVLRESLESTPVEGKGKNKSGREEMASCVTGSTASTEFHWELWGISWPVRVVLHETKMARPPHIGCGLLLEGHNLQGGISPQLRQLLKSSRTVC